MVRTHNHPVARVNLDDIQQNVATYFQQVEHGAILLVLKAGKPIAEITPIASEITSLRPYGLCAGEFTVPDDFDNPLPEDILHAFEER